MVYYNVYIEQYDTSISDNIHLYFAKRQQKKNNKSQKKQNNKKPTVTEQRT